MSNFSAKFANVDNEVDHFPHGADRDILVSAVGIMGPVAEVGCRQVHEREFRTICSPADRHDKRFDVEVAHGLLGNVHDVVHGFQLLLHVGVLVFHLELNG